MNVLVTGFEPNDDGTNASEVVVRLLQANLSHEISPYAAQLSFQILPGDTHILGKTVESLLDSLDPDICIGIGQARGYNKIAVERMAKNLRYFVTPDKAGNTPEGEPVIEGAPIAYWHSLAEIQDMVPLLERHNIPARVMNDCGTHLCNQAFYHLLHWKESHRADMSVGFIHIPALPEQVISQWPEAPFMPLEMTCHAIAIVIKHQIQAKQL